MFTRIVSFTDAKDIDAGIEFVRSTVAPVLHQQKGFRGTTASTDRAGGLFSVLSLWESEADRDASDSALLKVREEAVKIIGGHLSVELFEEVLFELVGGPPSVGSFLLVTRAKTDPAKVDDVVERFRGEVLPQIRTAPGLLAVRQMVNRETGDGAVGTIWSDADAMRAGLQSAEERQRTQELAVTIVDRSQREIVFVDLV
jgi:heme-degrading monooxygenase HmoA